MSVSSSLPAPVAACLEAIVERSADHFMATFSKSVAMTDEGTVRHGHEALRKWYNDRLVGHGATIDVKGATLFEGRIIVHLFMAGYFERNRNLTGPFPLYFAFTVSGREIVSLVITAANPIMRTVSVLKPDSEDPVSAIRLIHRSQNPTPEGWVRVKLRAVGLNYHDLFPARGLGMHPLKFPLILGCEGAGTLDNGMEVLIYPVMGDTDYTGDETLDPKRHVFSELTDGTLADFVVVPKRNVVVKPKELSFESAGVLGVAWLTAYRMLFVKSGLSAGQTMLVQGSSGGVTSALIQLGAAAGMRVWRTGRNTAKRELGIKLGAERVFVAGEVLPEKVDAVFDTSGEVTWEHSINSLKSGGTIVTCGGHSGTFVPLSLQQVFVEQLVVKGSYLGTLQEFQNLIAFVVEKSIVPHIGLVLPIERCAKGFTAMIEGKTEGKVVVTM